MSLARRLLPLVFAALPLAAEPPANLIADPGFEQAALGNTLPDIWNRFNAAGKECAASIVAGGHSGAHALRIAGNGEFCGVVVSAVPLAADQRYVVAAWVKADGDAQACVKVDYLKDGAWLGQTDPYKAAADGQWHEMAIADDRAKFADANQVALALVVGGGGQAWFDDVAFVALPADQGNRLPNGGFETGTDGAADGWSEAHPADESPKVSWTAAAAHGGLHGVNLKGAKTFHVLYAPSFPRDKAKVLTLSGWVRARSGGATLKFDFRNGDQWVGDQAGDSVPADGQWHEVKVVLDTTKFPEATELCAAILADGPDADADFDDVVMK
jgi:hypothetical protein